MLSCDDDMLDNFASKFKKMKRGFKGSKMAENMEYKTKSIPKVNHFLLVSHHHKAFK